MDFWKTAGVSLLILKTACFGGSVCAQAPAAASKVAVYQTPHFVLHTDLAGRDVPRALDRMEGALRFAKDYWRLRPRGKIRCYLVDAQENWLDSELPHPLVRVTVKGVGGVTVSQAVGAERPIRYAATIYASTAPGVVEHEVVHAYCMQAFGATGPDWYKEGMAEVGAMQGKAAPSVQCPEVRLRELRQTAPKTIAQILGAESMTGNIANSMTGMLAERPQAGRQIPVSRWTAQDAANLRQARRDYLWTWALCHFLVHNPNYASRFRALGESYLSGRDDSFQRTFGPVCQELDFEYRFFVHHARVGYRVDLCAWDWRTRFRALEDGDSVQRRVLAARGYQASGLTVSAYQRYAYRAEGAWSTCADGPLGDADGVGGQGQLVGVILSDFRLSEPFPLRAEGTFLAPASGNLYLRCSDAWDQLEDNRGEVRVRLSEL